MKLPKLQGSEPLSIPNDKRVIVVVGANGAGKSRFSLSLAKSLGQKAFSLSALHGLYGIVNKDVSDSSLGRLYATSGIVGATERLNSGIGELECALSMLMYDEMDNLIRFKLRRSQGESYELSRTKLDRVIDLWQETFPGNKMLIEGGRFLFSRRNEKDHYSAPKLSDGERTVIYYLAGVMYAPEGSCIFVNSPEIFLHPTVMEPLWTHIESLRPDCKFIYTTHDLEFTSSRSGASVVWVRDYNPSDESWDYCIIDNTADIGENVYRSIIGARKPVLFIEGDGVHSIDAKLYPLVFKEFTVKSLGSCNKVIEATRTFNDLNSFHHLDSYGIVDRDRRDEHEVDYLRGKRIMVPEVAEIENILMLEDVIRAVAHSRGYSENQVFGRVSRAIIAQFAQDINRQALMHTRHRVKRTVEYRIDGRFNDINALERHIRSLNDEIQPRQTYEALCREFHGYVQANDYASILKVYNQKTMIQASSVAQLCGLKNKEEYVVAIIDILHRDRDTQALRIIKAVKCCFGLE